MWRLALVACVFAGPALAQGSKSQLQDCALNDLLLVTLLEDRGESGADPKIIGKAVDAMLVARTACLQGKLDDGVNQYQAAIRTIRD